MNEKRLDSRLRRSLIVLGPLAVLAGCGSGSSHADRSVLQGSQPRSMLIEFLGKPPVGKLRVGLLTPTLGKPFGCAAKTKQGLTGKCLPEPGVAKSLLVAGRLRLSPSGSYDALALVFQEKGGSCFDLQIVRPDGRGAQLVRCLQTPSCGPVCPVTVTPAGKTDPVILGGLVSARATRLTVRYERGSASYSLVGPSPSGFAGKRLFMLDTGGKHVARVTASRAGHIVARFP
jgi:hypothetical protein